ncbi:hypothetical protein IQ02_00008 [Flavobacterium glaciei]|uniref:Uncharacterized protein n=1 Tax=Flavobacterium glaciei TaxID=386300 RepID=A0A562Q557_9FLAO|nr:hypothetical protein DFR66_1018 [Flavobacterium glaciei]TWI51881.1 hypothetical protein IQ02_00008 [Flavobacterium glaciei]
MKSSLFILKSNFLYAAHITIIILGFIFIIYLVYSIWKRR